MITHVQREPSALRDVPRVNLGRLKIAVTAGVGQGQTLLSAFDAALWQSGVHNYNLISLSSVIPPTAEVVLCDRYEPPEREFGHRLYVVKAEMRSAEVGAVIAAGLGWLQWGDARGIFVEHELQVLGQSQAEVETALADQITASLSDLARRRGLAFVPEQVRMHVLSAMVGPSPACVLVLAVYQADGWADTSATVERRPL